MSSRRDRGIGLVEWLVALALGTFVSVGALAVYARAAADGRTNGSLQQLHENARYAADLLEAELRAAGHAGLAPQLATVDGSTPPSAPVPPALQVAGCTPALALDLARPVTGADGEYALEPGVTLPCPPAPRGRTAAGADTLTIRRARQEPGAAERGRLQLATTRAGAVLFADGRVPPPYASGQVHDLEAATYYVSADALAPGMPSLRRKRLVGGASGPRIEDEELATGIEDLQVQFAVDGPDPDEVPEAYVHPSQLVDGDVVRAVRFWLRVRAEHRDPTWHPRDVMRYGGREYAPSDDGVRRVLVERTVFLRNLRRR